ncbi:basic helix-loop-helix (bHLH) DNA-binding superfamily protein [Rhynchospora pubera]|uniref:Protein IRON-RELATED TRANSCRIPTION FACTOR 2 n=1 Tax=Rhynchospora pubera TaxID=906938 RepID=A0AAV8E2J1_9POAL|nr:basic helix-loop-helix (bHLH) DNA-binding superfamily protein [Rhynchospora pubera]
MINSIQIQCENPFSSSISLEPDYFCESILPELELQEDHFLSTPSPKENTSSPNHFYKKLNHNAYERDRRKKLNSLYSSLRMLLPEAERSKKMSIPTTVSRVLKYIPELQKQVAKLTKKKEKLLLNGSLWQEHNSTSKDHYIDSLVVAATCLTDKEVMINICILSKRANKTPLFKYLEILEGEGLKVINASTSSPHGERIFYNLHFEIVQKNGMDGELLCEHLTKAIREKATK